MSTYLLVHGAWHSGQCWERVVSLLASAGHRVVAPSLTGHGDKAHLLGPEVGLDTHVDDIVRLITEEDLTDVILVGHSYAGLVISSAANRIPDRDRPPGLSRRDGPGERRERGGRAARDPGPHRPRRGVRGRLADPADARVATTPGPVRGHRPRGRGVAADDVVGSVGALSPATGPAGRPGRAHDSADAHPLRRRRAEGHRAAGHPCDTGQRQPGAGVGTGDGPRLHDHHAGRTHRTATQARLTARFQSWRDVSRATSSTSNPSASSR
ncbi:alpha/beta fold hydrolase [Streptosporangium sp. NPDC000095]|uniref:alpha/beta fold hydrolase n=1 Tax=Streptosporangium sp. NPDC000095 TaxID=3366184 RepID=UPI0036C5420F